MNIEDFRKRLRVSKHHLDDELEIHGELQEQISAQLAVKNTAMLGAKNDLASCEARLLQEAKETHTKITKDEAEAIVTRNPARRDKWREYQGAREELEEWQGLLDAWKQRGRDIRDLAQLFIASYFTVTSVGATPERRKRRPEMPD